MCSGPVIFTLNLGEAQMQGSAVNTCFLFWDLGVSACASWVQAWGSIIALAVTGGGLVYQASQQRKLAQTMARKEAAESYLRRAGAMHAIAGAANMLLLRFIDEFTTREAVIEKVASGEHEFLIGELKAMETWIAGVPVHDLPEEVLRETLILSSSVRQLLCTLKIAFLICHDMTADQFSEFAGALPIARSSIAGSALALAVHVSRARYRAEA